MLLTLLIVSTIVAIAVVIHYEALYRLTQLIPRLEIEYRFRILAGVICALIAHVVEIWLFAVGYYYMHGADDFGYLQGNYDGSLLTSAYFSFTTYTTLGFGDIEPIGNIRFLVGMEALVGLMMITWTASFMFIEMQRFWRTR